MEIQKLRGYGIAVSDSEGSWDPAFRAKINRDAQKIIMRHLTFLQKLRVLYWLVREKRRAAHLDLSDLRAKGMKNEAFLKRQLYYIAMFSALAKVRGKDDALRIMYEVMNAAARKALTQYLPEANEIKNAGEPIEILRSYFAIQPEAARKAGCHEMRVVVDTPQVLQFDILWCVWFELAKKMDIPEACIPNCYADDVAYPDYFSSLDIKYSRQGTLARGNKCCDFRFEKIKKSADREL